MCLDDDYCACPANMTGDPHWEQCQCPEGYVQNGTTCIALPACEGVADPPPCEEASSCEGIHVTVFVISILCGVTCAWFVGYQCALYHDGNPATVVPLRHHTNTMYESATGRRPLPPLGRTAAATPPPPSSGR